MRCQKVRSFLSAYCNDEIDGRTKLLMNEHLAECSSCRKEEAIYLSLSEAKNEIGGMKVSDDFNSKLLNRIGHERFAETRNKAYLPKAAPLFSWAKVVPALASASVMVLVAVSVFTGGSQNIDNNNFANSSLDDSYLTAEPTNNPNMTTHADPQWSFNQQMAKAERITQITNNLRSTARFGESRTGLVSSRTQNRVPFSSSYYRIRPVIRVYITSPTTSDKGGAKVY